MHKKTTTIFTTQNNAKTNENKNKQKKRKTEKNCVLPPTQFYKIYLNHK